MDRNSSPPIVWTIAGSDPGGGAGIQVDLKVIHAFGLHGCSVITALTAQNTHGVHSCESVSEAMLHAQLQTLKADLPPTTIKTGMLGNAATCSRLADFFQSTNLPVICDPVLRSTSGADLLDPAALDILIHGIFPKVKLLTPNLPEAERLIGRTVQSVEAAAEQLLQTGVHSVLIKGGHAPGDECRDYWTDGRQSLWLSSPRIKTVATHGTGCILSTAIAAAVARGQELPAAIITAKTFLNQCLKSPMNVGSGAGPMWIDPFRNDEADRPHVVGGGGDPAPENPESAPPATDPESTPPATTEHSHLRRLSKIFIRDPAYFITTCSKNRRKFLDNPAIHKILREEWEGALDRHRWAIGSYVVMPDHVHFFCKPTPEASKLSELMQHWKEWTSKRIKKELQLDGTVWQEEFFDHLLRSHESYSEKWNYVEQNPVRAGLTETAADWPYSGFIHYK